MSKVAVFYDNASTTRVDNSVLELYNYYQTEDYFNPSAPYSASMEVRKSLEEARQSLLTNLKGDGNLIFVSSGTEANNQALFCSHKQKTSRILISSAEHPAVYQAAMELKQRGFSIDFADVDKSGRVVLESFRSKMTTDTDIVSVMHVSNETGAVNDIAELVRIAKNVNKDVIFHSDGVQAVGKIPVNLRALGLDLYTFSGHKIHAPKGIAALFVKKGVNLRPYLFGGGQEFGLRSSTENVGGALSLDKSVKLSLKGMDVNMEKYLAIQKRLRVFLSSVDSSINFLSATEKSVPNILTFASKSVRGEVLLHALEGHGIMIGTGSACSSQKSNLRVPEAMGVPQEYLNGIIRLSFSKYNDISECEYFEKCFNLEYSKLKKYSRG